LKALIKPPTVAANILHEISSPVRFGELKPPVAESEVQFAFRNAPLIRHRFTLGDLLVFLNWDQETLWAQVNKNF